MLFMDTANGRNLEREMKSIPNFAPRGSGVVTMPEFYYTAEMCHCRYCPHYSGRKLNPCRLEQCDCLEIRIKVGAVSHREILAETLGIIKQPAFIRRLKEYLQESEGKLMKFRNDSHLRAFKDASDKIDCKNYAALSALYLLTVDHKLWQITKNHIERNRICFEQVRLKGIDENTYALYCAAKDLLLDTKLLSISDLADKSLISPMLFGLICNAMTIRRYGAEFLKKAGE